MTGQFRAFTFTFGALFVGLFIRAFTVQNPFVASTMLLVGGLVLPLMLRYSGAAHPGR